TATTSWRKRWRIFRRGKWVALHRLS
ncbi:uncharacterized protein METZ01_LOCUS147760, partial [marine metagenome]